MEKKEKLGILVHSLAVLNISDHYVRLKVNGGGCVLGGLMGTSGEGCVEVRSSFELPVENGAVDAAFVEERARQCKQVFPAHDMVGLYTAAPVSEALRAQIVRLIRGTGRVLLVLNPEDAKSSSVFPVSAYAMDTSGAAFERQPLRVVSDEPERIGIEHVAHHSSESQKSSQCILFTKIKITQVTFTFISPFSFDTSDWLRRFSGDTAPEGVGGEQACGADGDRRDPVQLRLCPEGLLP